MSGTALNRSKSELFTYSKVVLVEASGAITTVDFFLVDSIEGTDSTSSLEGELTRSTRKGTDATAVQGVASLADTHAFRDDLVGSTGEAVTIFVKNFVSLTLANAHGSLFNLSSGASTAVASNDNSALRTN